MVTSTPTTTTRIKKLPPLLINQLAAGEIVTRPASVVKELLENAIDAGATKIDIKVTQGGMGMIEVSDNGCGIHPDDMVMAVTRHATSKVADVANLQGIRTLGFRGEALASTAAVSRLTLSSSHDNSGIGRQLSVEGILADTPVLTPIVQEQGTTVLVKDLYFNVPARRGNLKSVATEFAHIESVVREVALAHADVSLTLYHDHRKRLILLAHTAEREEGLGEAISRLPLSRLEQALGMSLESQSMALLVDLSALLGDSLGAAGTDPIASTADSDSYTDKDTYSGAIDTPQIQGWLWVANHSAQPLPKLIYVNGRLIKDPIIAGQLRQAIQSLALNHYGYALYFELPTAWLNVNVHPSKQRINIHALANIMAHLNYAIKAKLGAFSPKDTPYASFEKTAHHSDYRVSQPSTNQVREPTSSYQTTNNFPKVTTPQPTFADAIAPFANSEVVSTNALAIVNQPINETADSQIGDLPVLLKVITDTAPLLDDSLKAVASKSPLLLLFWCEQHYLIHYDVWLSLLAQQDEGAEQMTEAAIVQHYQASLQPFDVDVNVDVDVDVDVDEKGSAVTWLYQNLNEQALAMIDVPQLLTIMLNSKTK
jgi:DNA mismatch repair protein MutL